ncbi:MAG: (Fe-S)-binding protein [Chloroflexota bacterium]
MLTIFEKILFIFAVVAALYYGYRNFAKVFHVIQRGKGEMIPQSEMIERGRKALQTWLTLSPTWKTRPVASIFHGLIAWGFIFYFLVNFGDVMEGMIPNFKFMGHGLLGQLYRFLADIFSLSVLLGMSYFLWRRFIERDPALGFRDNIKLMDKVKAGGIRQDSTIVGVFILLHVGFRVIGESFKIGVERTETGVGDAAQPLANGLSQLFWSDFSLEAQTIGWHMGWWVALGLILAFIPYFPYTKHFHLIMVAVNYFSKPKRTSLGALESIDFEDESIEEFGVAKLEDLPWTHLADAYSCIMCNRCQDVCPAYNTGKELSPAALEVNKRYYINENLDSLASGAESEFNLLDFAISESAVWACTACGACVDICPVGNEPMFDILYMRRHQVLMEDSFPTELGQAYRGMERNGNPWNQSANDRMAWAEGLTVPTIDENPDADVLWWVGCAPSYDPRAQKTAQSFAKILNHAGVNFAVLAEAETCTGDAARRTGNDYLYFELAQTNIEILNEVQPKRIVATCPHCLHSLGKEYGDLGGHYDVIHHTQLISELVAEKKLSYDVPAHERITFHDPCYLGRQNDIVDAPRDALRQGGVNIREMPRHGKQSFCCGAGGGQMWKEEEHGVGPDAGAVNENRYREAAATGADTVAVGCPFCLTMMTDASKAADDGVAVKDVAELIAENL